MMGRVGLKDFLTFRSHARWVEFTKVQTNMDSFLISSYFFSPWLLKKTCAIGYIYMREMLE